MGKFKYCYVDKRILWGVPISEVRVEDYLNTFGQKTSLEVVLTDGGFGAVPGEIEFFISILKLVFAVYGSVKTIVELPSDIKKFKKWIEDKMRQNEGNIDNLTFVEAIENRSVWTIQSLSEHLDTSEEIAGYLLREIGYRYNDISLCYELKEKLNDEFHTKMENIEKEHLEKYR